MKTLATGALLACLTLWLAACATSPLEIKTCHPPVPETAAVPALPVPATNADIESLVVELTEALVLSNAERETLRRWIEINCQ